MAQVDVSTSPIVGSSAWGSVASEMIGVGCSEAEGIPKWCWICLRMAVCWVWVAKIYSWWARRAAISWVRMLWDVVNVCKVWQRPLYSDMDIAILGSDDEVGSDVAGITRGVYGVAGGADGATSGIGSSGCGMFGCSVPTRAPGSVLYAVIFDHLSKVNISRQIRLRSWWGSDG